MENRKDKLAKLAKGPGVFTYLGGLHDTKWTPTALRTSGQEPVLDANGYPVSDSSGRQVYRPAGEIVRDDKGQPMLGGPPIKQLIELETKVLWGVEFPKGEKVSVENPALALKLRALPDQFEEQEGAFVKVKKAPGGAGKAVRDKWAAAGSDAAVASAVEEHETKAKRGRPRKSDA